MQLSTIWDQAKENTTKASEVARQAAYAGIAIIWVFREPQAGQSTNAEIPQLLVVAGVILILTLALDLLQYIVTSVRYRTFGSKSKETLVAAGVPNDQHGDHDFPLPRHFHVVPGLFFWGKIGTVLTAYVLIAWYLGKRFLV